MSHSRSSSSTDLPIVRRLFDEAKWEEFPLGPILPRDEWAEFPLDPVLLRDEWQDGDRTEMDKNPFLLPLHFDNL